jgi:hypothetical protein
MRQLDTALITVAEARECASTTLLDLVSFLTTKVLPIYLTVAKVTPFGIIAATAADVVIKVVEKYVRGIVIDDCLAKMASKHQRIDSRITIVSKKKSPVGHRVRQRKKGMPLKLNAVWGGGSFGGAGGGAEWEVVEPMTGITIDSNPEPSTFGITEDGNQIIVNGARSRPIVQETVLRQLPHSEGGGFTSEQWNRKALVKVETFYDVYNYPVRSTKERVQFFLRAGDPNSLMFHVTA